MMRDRSGESANTPLLCAIGVCLVYAAFFPAAIYSVDGNSMLAVSESLITRHSFTVPTSGLGAIGRHGFYYSMWYPLLSILALPPVAVGVLISHRLGLPQHYIAATFALTLSPILTAATALMVILLARRLGATTRGAMLAALGFAFGTIALVYSRRFFADPLLALLTVAGIYFSLGRTSRETGGAIAAATLAVLAKPTGIVLGPCLGAYLLCKRRPFKRWVAPACGTLAGLLIYFAYNWARFANPLNFGQAGTFALSVIPHAIAGLLISPGRGLLWYSPAILAVAAVPGVVFKRWESALIVIVAGAYLAEHSIWIFWAGGWSWGPRLLLPAIPGLMALAGLLERRRRWLLVALMSAGFIIGAPNLISFYERYYQEASAAKVSVQTQEWSFGSAPLFRIWGAAWRETADAYHNADQVGAFVH
ncbi:MAG: glycosyltransferase family 39 protein [Candidatus Binataceae bacterium]